MHLRWPPETRQRVLCPALIVFHSGSHETCVLILRRTQPSSAVMLRIQWLDRSCAASPGALTRVADYVFHRAGSRGGRCAQAGTYEEAYEALSLPSPSASGPLWCRSFAVAFRDVNLAESRAGSEDEFIPEIYNSTAGSGLVLLRHQRGYEPPLMKA